MTKPIQMQLRVKGEPVPAGSYRPVPIRKQGIDVGSRVINDNPKTKGWQTLITWSWWKHVRLVMGPDWFPWGGPVVLRATFYFARPAAHYGRGKYAEKLRRDAPAAKVTKPDVSKLLRAIEDAMTGVVYKDDAQIVSATTSKEFGEPGCLIEVDLYEWSPLDAS